VAGSLLLSASWLSAVGGNYRSGFVAFQPEEELKPFKEKLPVVEDPRLQSILASPDTMWYDHNGMIPVYQDSIKPILGVRANSIGRDLAVEGHRVFNRKKQFHFPYSTTAGMEDCDNVKVLTFWSPPKANGEVLPVVWWNDNTTRYRWLFPKGTVFGEVLYLQASDGHYFAFEIRTRERFLDSWGAHAFRPFPTAKKLAEAIQRKRPNWQSSLALRKAVIHLLDDNTLESSTLESQYFAKAFEPVSGFLDKVPDLGDGPLVEALLRETPFTNVEGEVWKRQGTQESYAASTETDFHIVPKGYNAGLIPVNDVSCNRCHEDTGRQFGEFSFNSLLYGEIWGEDRIFSWHLFEPNESIYGAFHQNRKLNSLLAEAKLIEAYSLSKHPGNLYKELPRRFKIHWY
jgi:hypothetical protein